MRYIVLLIIVVLFALAGIVFYYGQKAAEVPDVAGDLKTVDIDTVEQHGPTIQKRLENDLAEKGFASLSEAEIEILILNYLEESAQLDIQRIVHSSHVSMRGKRLQLAFNINVNKIASENLPKNLLAVFTTMRTMITEKDLSEVYVSVDGTPQLKGNVLSFEENALLQIGALQYRAEGGKRGIVNAGFDEFERWSVDTVFVKDGRLVLASKNRKNSFE